MERPPEKKIKSRDVKDISWNSSIQSSDCSNLYFLSIPRANHSSSTTKKNVSLAISLFACHSIVLKKGYFSIPRITRKSILPLSNDIHLFQVSTTQITFFLHCQPSAITESTQCAMLIKPTNKTRPWNYSRPTRNFAPPNTTSVILVRRAD